MLCSGMPWHTLSSNGWRYRHPLRPIPPHPHLPRQHCPPLVHPTDVRGFGQSRWLFVWNTPNLGEMEGVNFVAAADLDQVCQYTDALLHVLEYIYEHDVDIHKYCEVLQHLRSSAGSNYQDQWRPVPLFKLQRVSSEREELLASATAERQARAEEEKCVAARREQQEQDRRERHSAKVMEFRALHAQQTSEIARLRSVIARLNSKLPVDQQEHCDIPNPPLDEDEVDDFGLAGLAIEE